MGLAGEFPSFDNPPVVEVAFGVQFKAIKKFLAPHYGVLWKDCFPNFSECQEQGPLAPTIETISGQPPAELTLSEVPPLPRIWLSNSDDHDLVQLQRDRFFYNWRKIDEDDKYPRYAKTKSSFVHYYKKFANWIGGTLGEEIVVRQLELTYFNHLEFGGVLENFAEIDQILPDFNWRSPESRLLKTPSNINWNTSFDLPEIGSRLHFSVRPGRNKASGANFILMELTVRGLGQESGPEAVEEWFDQAREWIVKGFADLTSEAMQSERWGRSR